MHASSLLALTVCAALAGSARPDQETVIPPNPLVRALETGATTRAPVAGPVERSARTGFRGDVMAGPVDAEVIDVIDGDTIEVRATVWLGQSLVTRVRLRGIDAAEMSSECGEERDLARASRDALIGYLGPGRIKLTDISRDKYGGRVVARVLTGDGEDVGVPMLAAGYAITYDGGRREPWCGVKQLTSKR